MVRRRAAGRRGPHQLDLLRLAGARRSALLVAPTGAGKTLAGFLPSLVDLAGGDRHGRAARGLHTLYISPLKALAVDIARNLEAPVAEMGLPVRVETRTGDTPAAQAPRARSSAARHPADHARAARAAARRTARPRTLLRGPARVVLDELHSLVTSKRGDLLSLGLARLRRLAPGLHAVGLSATVARARRAAALAGAAGPAARTTRPSPTSSSVVRAARSRTSRILDSGERLPWAGHTARYAHAGDLRR